MLNDTKIAERPAPNFLAALRAAGQELVRSQPTTLQVNVGRLCNLTCIHCHVNAGPSRKEIMTRETVDGLLGWLEKFPLPIVDLTGGAPEMIPDFRYLIETLRAQDAQRRIIDRCNLTILLEPGYEGLAEFMAQNRVEITASMPCYSPDNVNAQRGDGVFDGSIKALQLLNSLGYGIDDALPLNLVYNPVGASLPPDQAELEADYKTELKKHFGIEFHQLYTITNMPIARFASWLKRQGQLADYMKLLVDNFNPGSVNHLMCRDTLSIDWQGYVYDCDFNQQLGMIWAGDSPPRVWDITEKDFSRPIATGPHCFGCTAGAGSSCGGALN
ncbi:MAG: arsenosugar biosynthesis radical SAM (seleno)protein ArsS [Verrucomicrobiota bacterium]